MKTNSSRKTALIVIVIFIAFALGFYWLSKDSNVSSTANNTASYSEVFAQSS